MRKFTATAQRSPPTPAQRDTGYSFPINWPLPFPADTAPTNKPSFAL